MTFVIVFQTNSGRSVTYEARNGGVNDAGKGKGRYKVQSKQRRRKENLVTRTRKKLLF